MNYLVHHFKVIKDYLFLPREEIKNYNVLIHGRNLYDQPIDDLIKQYDDVRKVSTGKGDYYTTRCLLEQIGGFLGMLLGTLGGTLLGNMLAGKGIIRAGYGSKKKNLISPHPLTNFEI